MKIKISKVSVNKTLEGQWSIVFNLKITDDEGKTELLTQNFTEDYKTGMELSNVGNKTEGFYGRCRGLYDNFLCSNVRK
jgi:flagellar biosynthesis/type III secretory pathway chaperone